MAGWAANARTRILKLRAEVENIQNSPALTVGNFKKLLDNADEELKFKKRLISVVMGDGAERVWGPIHAAEEVLLSLERDPDRARSQALRCGGNSVSRKRVEDWKKEFEKESDTAKKLRLACDFQQEAHSTASGRYNSERNKQRGMLLLAILLLMIAGVVLLLQRRHSGSSFLPEPEDASVSGFPLLALVMIHGLLGGLLSGLVNLYIRTTSLDHTQWFDIKPVSICVNASLGLWTAFIGLMAVGTGLIVGKYQSLPAVLLLALIFGYGQQAVVNLLDKRAIEISGQKVADVVDTPK